MNKIKNLRWILVIFLLINIGEVNGFVYEIELNYNQGNLSFLYLEITDRDFYEQTGIDYYADIIGRNNQSLEYYFFPTPSFTIYDIYDPEIDHMIGGGTDYIEESNLTLILPYYSQGERIDIYDTSELEPMLSIDISQFSQTNCGDNVCSSTESFFTCPEDCQSGELDNYCDNIQDNKCDPDCAIEEDQDCLNEDYIPETKKDNNQYLLIGGLILILLIIIILILREKRKQNN
tara:strand:+ start:426 stop:1124 length:699 start_codon:yes stop_codon:yes gene_type:complete